MESMSTLEIVAVVVNALGVWLTVQRIRWCWPVGLVAVALYGWIFHSVRLYADMLLQGVYAALLAYGWWQWRRAPTEAQLQGQARQRHLAAGSLTGTAPQAGDSTADVASGHAAPVIAPITQAQVLSGLATGAITGVALALLMIRFTDAAAPWLDAPLCTYSLVASLWAARRQTASWLLWIVLDVIYAGLYLAKGLPLTAGLYAVFVGMAAVGWWRWRQAWLRQQAASAASPTATGTGVDAPGTVHGLGSGAPSEPPLVAEAPSS